MADMSLYTIRPSARLRAYVVVLHLVALLSILLAELAWPWRIALFGTVILGLARSWRRAAEIRLHLGAPGGPRLWIEDAWRVAEVLPDSVVLPWLAVIRLRVVDDGRLQTVVVLGDSLPGEDFRRLRVDLRHPG